MWLYANTNNGFANTILIAGGGGLVIVDNNPGLEDAQAIKHNVRNVFGGYIGWWDGDPATLDPTPRREQARRTIALMGGRDKVFQAANTFLSTGDPQWAVRLLTLVAETGGQRGSGRT